MAQQHKNICHYCGGQMVIEYIGSYGSVYKLKKNGEPYKTRYRKYYYEEQNDGAMIYCLKCGNTVDKEV